MGGGGTGTGRGSGGSREARYHLITRHSCHLKSSPPGESDEAEFIASLKAEVENEIARSGASVTACGDLNVPGFYFRYATEGIQGRIELSGRFTRESVYTLTAAITEATTIEEQPSIEWVHRGCRTAGLYYVVPFMPGDQHASANDFQDIGRRAIKESIERVRKRVPADQLEKQQFLHSLESVEVYVLERTPPEIRQRWAKMTGETFGPPADYYSYEKVYFLNDVALRMYRDAEAEFQVLKAIPANEVPGMAFPLLAGPYIAKEAQ